VPVEKLKQGRTIRGTMLQMISNPAAVRLAEHAGLDFLMLDMEHGWLSFENLAQMCAVARAGSLAVFVRVPELARSYISRALDCGAHGVMVPMVETEAQAREFVRWAKYPPVGGRGLCCGGPHTDYFRERDSVAAMANGNRQTLTIAQIETATGVENAEAIAAVEGIDSLLIGPADLSVSRGCPGNITCETEERAIEQVAKAAARQDKAFGAHTAIAALERWMPFGMNLLMCDIDMDMIASAFARVNEDLKRLSES
jgi:4-hydroxy-2-oxoheptanedioate aldolase